MARTEAHIKIASEERASTGATGALPLKTNQTTSYATGDDGDLQEGRDVDFFTLPSANPFGTTERFTDVLGTQVYSDKIAIDWTTYDGTEVLGFSQNSGNPTVNWATCIANASSHSVGIYTSGWRLPNVNEVFPLLNYNQTYLLYYPPFNTTMGWTFIYTFWLSTTKPQSSNTAYQIFLTSGITTSNKNNSRQWFAVRNFTVTGGGAQGGSLQAGGIPAGGASLGSGGSFGLPGGTIGGAPGGTIGGTIGGTPGAGITLT